MTAQLTKDAKLARGEFTTLHGWLREQIYTHGGKYPTAELVERVLGGPTHTGAIFSSP